MDDNAQGKPRRRRRKPKPMNGNANGQPNDQHNPRSLAQSKDHSPHPVLGDSEANGTPPQQRGRPTYDILVKNKFFGKLTVPVALMQHMDAGLWHAMIGYGFVVRCEYMAHIPGFDLMVVSEFFEPVEEDQPIPEYISTFDHESGTVSYSRVEI